MTECNICHRRNFCAGEACRTEPRKGRRMRFNAYGSVAFCRPYGLKKLIRIQSFFVQQRQLCRNGVAIRLIGNSKPTVGR